MPQLLCTVRDCHEPLHREERRVLCPRGHSFDIARSGYVNLLQPQDRRARVPGDNPEAVAARRRFLDGGYAEPLLEAVRDIVAPASSRPVRGLPVRRKAAGGPAARVGGDTVLDVGCGEGHYLGSIDGGCGVDISTAAIDLAAGRYPQCEWVVANADRFIPYADASFDVVMSITGRMNPSEFRRVMKSDGRLLVAVAAPDDLLEVRGRPNRDRVSRTIETFSDHFEFVEQQRATTQADLDKDAVRDLLAATYRAPHPRFAGPSPRERGEGVPRTGEGLQRVTLSLDLLLFTSRPVP